MSEDGGSRNRIEDHHWIEMLLGMQVLNNSKWHAYKVQTVIHRFRIITMTKHEGRVVYTNTGTKKKLSY